MLDASYYVNDLARSITQFARTMTIDLDPAMRPRQRTSVPGAAEVTHYADDSDEPAWMDKAGVISRDIPGIDGDLVATSTWTGAGTHTTTLQITNLHGDVVGEAPATAAQAQPSVRFESDEFGVPKPGRGPIVRVGAAKTALSAAGTSLTVSVPQDVQPGDLLLGMVAAGATATVTTPSGWTATTADRVSGTVRYRLLYRFADGSEPASYAFALSASAKHIGAIVALRNTSPTSPFNVLATSSGSVSGGFTVPALTPTVGDTALERFVGQVKGDANGGSVFDFPAAFSKDWEATTGPATTDASAASALRLIAGGAGVSTGSTTLVNQTANNNSAAWGAISAAIAPAGPTPTQARYGYLGGKQRYTTQPTGIIEMGARIYAPGTGRFLQPDPVYGGSANAYDYANQDPVNQVDLDGNCVGPLIALAPACIRVGATAAVMAFRYASRTSRVGQGVARTVRYGQYSASLDFRNLIYSPHAMLRMAGRRISEGAVKATLRRGTIYWDPKNSSYNYYLLGGGGKYTQVAVNAWSGTINTVIRTRKIPKRMMRQTFQ